MEDPSPTPTAPDAPSSDSAAAALAAELAATRKELALAKAQLEALQEKLSRHLSCPACLDFSLSHAPNTTPSPSSSTTTAELLPGFSCCVHEPHSPTMDTGLEALSASPSTVALRSLDDPRLDAGVDALKALAQRACSAATYVADDPATTLEKGSILLLPKSHMDVDGPATTLADAASTTIAAALTAPVDPLMTAGLGTGVRPPCQNGFSGDANERHRTVACYCEAPSSSGHATSPCLLHSSSGAGVGVASPLPATSTGNHGDNKEILSHCSDISGSPKTPDAHNRSLHSLPTKRSPAATKTSHDSRLEPLHSGAVSKKKAVGKGQKKRNVPAKPKIPGQSRYWTPEEHKLFLEALNKYGHKDLRSISAWVGTRNMTQVRTHAQKYFMRLMREAKRQNPIVGDGLSTTTMTTTTTTGKRRRMMIVEGNEDASPLPVMVTEEGVRDEEVLGDAAREGGFASTKVGGCGVAVNVEDIVEQRSEGEENGSTEPCGEGNDKYSVPSTCGMTLLCLVGQDTLQL